MNREEWLTRCAARFEVRAGMHLTEARGFAEAVLENLNDDTSESPEEAADEDMSCWTDDGYEGGEHAADN